MRRSSLLLSLLVIQAGPLSGQARAVRGIVIDSVSRKPLAGAIAYASRAMDGEPTRKDGKFSLTVGSPENFFVVRVPGYVPARVNWASVDSAGDVGTVPLRKAKSEADLFAVQAEDIRLYPRLAPFYDRRNSSRQGAFLTPDEVQLRSSSTVSEVIRRTGGLTKLCLGTSRGELDCGRTGDRGPTSINNTPAPEQVCPVAIWFYGFNGPDRPTLDQLRMSEIVALEGYGSPGSTPREFQDAQCGAIVLWMKSAVQ